MMIRIIDIGMILKKKLLEFNISFAFTFLNITHSYIVGDLYTAQRVLVHTSSDEHATWMEDNLPCVCYFCCCLFAIYLPLLQQHKVHNMSSLIQDDVNL